MVERNGERLFEMNDCLNKPASISSVARAGRRVGCPRLGQCKFLQLQATWVQCARRSTGNY